MQGGLLTRGLRFGILKYFSMHDGDLVLLFTLWENTAETIP